MNKPALRLDDQLCFALYTASNAITRVYRPLLARIGLTFPQYLVMVVLWERGPRSIAGLAAELRLPPNALTPIVTRLQRAGLVDRATDPQDGRVRRILVTEAGRALEPDAAAIQAEVGRRMAMDETEIAALREQLHDMTRRLDDAVSSAEGGSAVIGATAAPLEEDPDDDEEDHGYSGGGAL